MNNESVLVRSYGSHSSWTFPEVSNYPDESHLQEILAANPTFIAGVPDRSLTVRELSIGAWFVDVSVVGPDGSLTLVECKLDSNSEPRRMMLGQILDYASAIHLAGFESFLERWKRRGGPNLEDFLDHTALQSLRSNIETGRIHLAFAVDRIDASLQQVIEYLNKVTRDDVMVTALRLSYMRHGDIEILIPTVYGAELAQAKNPARQNATPWTWVEFLDAIPSQPDRLLAEDLYQRLMREPTTGTYEKIWCGNRPGGGIFFQIHGERYSAFQLWLNSAGTLMVYGNWTNWPLIASDERFAEVAAVLGQTHTGSSKSVPISEVDLDRLWEVAVTCDRALNPLN